MAYDRTIRFPKIITQTSVKVGPGTYEISDVTCPDRHLGTKLNNLQDNVLRICKIKII